MAVVITDWATLAEPAPRVVFAVPSYAADLQIANSGNGIGMVTPDGTKLFRVYVDSDGAVSQEFIANFAGVPATFPPPFGTRSPVFGVIQNDLLILAAGAGILFPAGPPAQVPRVYYRLRIDNDGTPGTEPASSAFWVRVPEGAMPVATDILGNWIFTQDMMLSLPGTGVVMPMRGLTSTRRIRLDFDGDIISE